MRAFDRYAPFVQEYIYRNHWENLRSIQVAAADAGLRRYNIEPGSPRALKLFAA